MAMAIYKVLQRILGSRSHTVAAGPCWFDQSWIK